MKKLTEIIGFFFQALVLGLAIAFVVIYLWPNLANRGAGNGDSQQVAPAQASPGPSAPASYAEAVNRAAPAVVSIYTTMLDPQPVTPELQERLGDRYLYRMRRDMGSGVLVSDDGYILTNHHVISQAQRIRVALWDGRLATAKVVGSDPETDLAVLKIKLDGLPTAPMAGGPAPRVGDVVLAIGNALGLSHTVTMGIISATRRQDAGSPLFEGFLQTDAAINAGNSGGALVNVKGELIGINTRKLGGIQGAEGIGFAIPMEIAQGVMDQIIEYGSVQRGWLGAVLTDFPPATLPEDEQARRGIYVYSVARGGPAWLGGIREGDAIASMNGVVYDNTQSLNLTISSTKPGAQVELEVRRGKETFQTYATLIQQPPMP